METKGKFPNGLAPLMEKAEEGPSALARALDTSRQNVARWANWDRKIPPEFAEAIANHYNVSFQQVMLPPERIPEIDREIASALQRLSRDEKHDVLKYIRLHQREAS